MIRRGREYTAQLDSAVQDLAPAYFALVMATGIVSLTAQAMGIPLLARSLFWLNAAFYGVLWFLTVWRILRFGRRLGADLKDYQRGPGFFSVVAGSAILGSQFILLAKDETMGMLLSGTDFDHNRTPYEASISFIVNKDHEFIGKEPLEKSREERTEIFRGFRVEGRSLPRGGCRILKDGRQVGTVTSGGTSPVLGIPIALGFIDRSLSKEGNSVDIEIRSNLSPATVSKPKLVK